MLVGKGTDMGTVYMEFDWEECSIEKAFDYAEGKKRLSKWPTKYAVIGPEHGCDFVFFTDETCLACHSAWSGPYSEVTPDIDAEPPKWWIGTNRREAK